jgi:hypothetical protein
VSRDPDDNRAPGNYAGAFAMLGALLFFAVIAVIAMLLFRHD